ncbi:hypothetical protein CEXT_522091 [Caerostris extrusa]|uniref:Uncharacterized protein n=1 Tax=Caerostris extrusa TaxID=172846 RepID=A0AAV4Y1Y2_CAEEX|nr:hypothetical protein CEXT_522091 [Caerostris extrusa]
MGLFSIDSTICRAVTTAFYQQPFLVQASFSCNGTILGQQRGNSPLMKIIYISSFDDATRLISFATLVKKINELFTGRICMLMIASDHYVYESKFASKKLTRLFE